MLTELCKEINNYFDTARWFGKVTIHNGAMINIDFLQEGQYFRIVGSVFNDGVYQYPTKPQELKDEVFDGAIWAMAVPKEVIALASEINDWKAKYQSVDSAAMSPFTSESFGGYSYSKGGAGADGDDGGSTWQGAFKTQLNKYRKIRV